MWTAIIIGIVIFLIVIFAAVIEHKKQANIKMNTGFYFVPTKKIESNSGMPIAEFDDRSKQCRFYGSWGNSDFYPYSSIVSFELLEDGEAKISGGLGTALIGGALFGGVGAIVGGVTGTKTSRDICKSLKIKVTVNNMNNPAVYLTFIDDTSGVEKRSSKYKRAYKLAHECLSVLQLICNIQNQPGIIITPKQDNVLEETNSFEAPFYEEPALPEPRNTMQTTVFTSSADEIRKLKDLLDNGVITEEEFSIAKKKLLGL